MGNRFRFKWFVVLPLTSKQTKFKHLKQKNMETEFIQTQEKEILMKALKIGDNDAIKSVFDEISRLENVIKDYEIGIYHLNNKFNCKVFKRPASINK